MIQIESIAGVIELGEILSLATCRFLMTANLDFRASRFAWRTNTEALIHDRVLCQELNDVVAGKLQYDTGLTHVRDPLEIYKYEKGQRIDVHRDDRPVDAADASITATLLVYLNDEYVGGRTVFPDIPLAIEATCGHGILFPHGIRHEGEEVREGVKFVLRTDVTLEPRREEVR